MGNVYYPNAFLLIFSFLELHRRWREGRLRHGESGVPTSEVMLCASVFGLAFLVALFPTFITRAVIYGSPFASGYPKIGNWNWGHPAFWSVLFSSRHGLWSWTPILIFAVFGLFFLRKRSSLLGLGCILVFLSYYYFIASYPDWHGISSFGNRFFVSLTPIFVLGLAKIVERFCGWTGGNRRAAFAQAGTAISLLILWNLGFIFQWGTHLVPARDPISWSAMGRNQFVAVPQDLARSLKSYFSSRTNMMQNIEQKDIEQQLQRRQEDE